MRHLTIASKESKKVHVTFGDSKRIMSYEKGVEVKELRSLFLSEFSDVLADDISPANVKFQVLDETFKDYVDLGNNQQLEENAQIKAITFATKEKQVHSNCHAEDGSSHFHPCHIVIPWYLVTESQGPTPPDLKPHTIKKDVPYRFWNPVSNGLMQKVGQQVTCSGGFPSSDTMIQAKSVGDNEFHLVYNGDGPPNGYLYITSTREGQEVTVSSTPTSGSIFVPNYYWGQTMFRSKPYSTLYLGSDGNRNATLVTMDDPFYPNPQALFIVNKYNPTTPISTEK
ncbi:uncharacterized protein LOC110043887 isoform X4 [Orbicella faveolata]|uniref:uncharacterized protein LOC110043887 isoform X4 n=1 Tax=Orbicella faveolata TaxID=48498 RepID=UPI0009E4577D|nr:uncharacterized protein LOC110043887 isoform X4 [Orbicella faveolata]